MDCLNSVVFIVVIILIHVLLNWAADLWWQNSEAHLFQSSIVGFFLLLFFSGTGNWIQDFEHATTWAMSPALFFFFSAE
jgi:hypothetical protein